MPGSSPESIDAALVELAAGRLVGLPTETVYGLAADACNDAAVAAIFAAKGRPSDHPLIVHIAHAEAVDDFAASIPPFARLLMQAYWPGPLTLILPRREGIARAAAGGQDSIGLRCPAHPVAHTLLASARQRGVHGLAAPSANRFGRVSPTTAAHVQDELGDALLVLDGGACEVGIESTIIDCTRGTPVLLRPGMHSQAALSAACGTAVLNQDELPALAPRASGTLEAHYAPNAKVRLMPAKALQTALDLLGADAASLALYTRTKIHPPSAQVHWRRMPADARQAAHDLFADLRALDALQVRLIWVESPPDTPEWDGVRDRLRRAAAS